MCCIYCISDNRGERINIIWANRWLGEFFHHVQCPYCHRWSCCLSSLRGRTPRTSTMHHPLKSALSWKVLKSCSVQQSSFPPLHYLLFHWKSKGQAIQSFQTVTVHCINSHSKHLWCWENSTMWIPGSLGPVPQFGFFAAPLAFSFFIAYTLHVVGRFLWNRQSTNMLLRQDTKTIKTQVCQSFRNGIQQQNVSARGGQSIFNRPEYVSIPWCCDIYRWKLCCTSTHDINDIHWWLKSPFYTKIKPHENQAPAPLEVDFRFRSLSFKGGPSWMTPCLEECFVREAFLGTNHIQWPICDQQDT